MRLISLSSEVKEEGPDGIPRYAADPERAAQLAGIAVRHARLAATPNAAKRVAIMLSSYPTKHARVGTRSAWTPRRPPWRCCGPCARPATTSATASPKTATR